LDSIIYCAQNGTQDNGITKDELKEIDRLFKVGEKALLDLYIKEKRYKKWNLKPVVEKLDDTWRYFENETVSNLIKKLGYDGYVAKEKKYNTYLIFDPNKTITILKKQK
jgi:hypothetical protein